MTELSLDAIKIKVDELAAHIQAPTKLLPTYGYSNDGALPHIEVEIDGSLHYIIIERGQEVSHKTINNLDELLYWIFADITFSMSTAFELRNRVPGKDFRRLLFEKQEDLLGILSENWRQREQEEHKGIVKNHPFND